VGDEPGSGQATPAARYCELRDAGLEALAAGDFGKAISRLSAAAVIQRGLPEAHVNLARALRADGKLEAARQALRAALGVARDSAADIQRELKELPEPPPPRLDFKKAQVIYSGLTGNRWTVLDVKRGGFGAVYKVRDHEDSTIHALKTFQARFIWSEADRNRFIREAATWIRLDPHPNIVRAEWIEVIEEFPCVVQEYVEGGDLADLLSTQTLTVPRALELAIQFCDGMDFAHSTLGIVHRDIKSSNCLITAAGAAKIGDFGLARAFSESRASALDAPGIDASISAQYTTPIGTWAYMAPEQLNPEARLDRRTDIHAFGVMLYEMLTRDLAAYYEGEQGRGLKYGWHAHDYIATATRRFRAPKALWRLVLACVESEPGRRPSSFGEIRADLARLLRKLYKRDLAPPRLPVKVGADYWNNKAVAFQAIEMHEDAVACYDRALKSSPDDPDLWQNKGAALLSLKRYREALTSLDHAVHLADQDGVIWNNKGLAQQGLGQFEQALDSFRKAFHLSPRDPVVCKNIAQILFESGNLDEAREWIAKGLVFDSRNAALHELNGFALLALGKVLESESSFSAALAIAPRRFGAWKGKALANDRIGNSRLALDHCNTALEIQAADLDLLKCKTRILISFGDWQGAAKAMKGALALRPGDAESNKLAQRIATALSSEQCDVDTAVAHAAAEEDV